MTTDYKKWVAGLKVGDEAYLFYRSGLQGNPDYTRLIVTAVTRWTVSCKSTKPGREDYVTHYRRTGASAGKAMVGKDCLQMPDADRVAQIDAEQHRRKLARDIREYDLEKLDTSVLEQIKGMLP